MKNKDTGGSAFPLPSAAYKEPIPGGTELFGMTLRDYFADFAKGLAVNCTSNISEVGNALAANSKTYGMVWYMDQDGGINVSLRSIGDYDVSSLAKLYGGGGHKNAAGCRMTVPQLLEVL